MVPLPRKDPEEQDQPPREHEEEELSISEGHPGGSPELPPEDLTLDAAAGKTRTATFEGKPSNAQVTPGAGNPTAKSG